MSTKKSWALTPREFQALERVYQNSLYRWGFERAFEANVQGVKHVSGRPFSPDDFINTPESRLRKLQADRDAADLAAAKREEARQFRLMKAGKFPEDQLPVWARMTAEEKAARGMVAEAPKQANALQAALEKHGLLEEDSKERVQ